MAGAAAVLFRVDWLQFSVRTEDYRAVRKWVADRWLGGDVSVLGPFRPVRFFGQSWRGPDGLMVMAGHNSVDDLVSVQLKGAFVGDRMVADVLGDLRDLDGQGWPWYLTRLDLAWDDVGFSPGELWAFRESKWGQADMSMVAGDGGIETCYVGARSSPLFLCVYRKAERDGAVRCELRIRGEAARGAWERLRGMDSEGWEHMGRRYVRRLVDFPVGSWRRWMDGVERVSYRADRDQLGDDKAERVAATVRRYRSTLAKYVLVYGTAGLLKHIREGVKLRISKRDLFELEVPIERVREVMGELGKLVDELEREA